MNVRSGGLQISMSRCSKRQLSALHARDEAQTGHMDAKTQICYPNDTQATNQAFWEGAKINASI